MQQMDRQLLKCAWILFELDWFGATGVDDQRARYLLLVLYSHQLPHHISSRPDLKFQCQWNYTIIWRNWQTWSSPIQGNLISFQVHWYSTMTFSWLIIFLQLHIKEADMRDDILKLPNNYYDLIMIYFLVQEIYAMSSLLQKFQKCNLNSLSSFSTSDLLYRGQKRWRWLLT